MACAGGHSLRKYVAIWLVGLGLIVATAATAQDLVEELPNPKTPRPEAQTLPTRTIPTEENSEGYLASLVLTVDQERLFAESAWGKRVALEIEEKGRTILAENKRIEKQMSDDEADLTDSRDALDPAEFRKKAEAFDTRAMEVRRERASIVQKLNAQPQEERTAFLQAALPIMGEVMQRREAAVVLDRRTVFVSLEAIDITDELIEEIDARIGAGPEPKEASEDTENNGG